MSGSISRVVRDVRALAGGVLVACAAIACASTAPTPGGSQEGQAIADVRVESEGQATVVTLMGLDHPVFTAFEQQDPERLVVDLAATRPEGVLSPVAVYDGIVEEIALSSFASGSGEPSTRVEITRASAGEFEVVPAEDGLVIRIHGVTEMEPMQELEATQQEGASFDDDPWAIATAPAADATSAADAAPAPPASALEAVETQAAGDGWLVHLRADGTIASATTFTLEEPARLVIDLPGVASKLAKDRFEVDSPFASRVRVGQHEDHVRVVIDAGSDPQAFENRRVVPASDGLVIALGGGTEIDAAVDEALGAGAQFAAAPGAESQPSEDGAAEAAAPEAEAAGEAAQAVVTIYGVEFDAQEQRDRIVVLSDEPVPYFVYEPDDETVVLSMEGAAIDPEAAVRIAPAEAGPVSLVTAFAQPETTTPEVRVVIKRAAGLKPEISRRGALLVVDFPRTGAIAARPPVLESGVEPTAEGAALGETPAATGAMAGETPVAGSETAAAAGEAPASIEPVAQAAASDAAAAPGEPASLEPPAAISILQEGGLLDSKQYSGRRISLDFKEVEIADVLRLIAEVSNLNVIAGDEVKGRVTIRLVDVPWDQALDVILLTKGLGFMRVGNVLRIASADVLAQEEEVRLQERRAKEKLEDLVVKLQPVNYANVGDVSGMVSQLLTPRGSVNVDRRTNTLIIKDIPSVIDEATALIRAIDTQTPQVMIEAKIVEANLDFSREFGSVWGIGAQPLVDAFDPGSGVRQDLGGQDFLLNTNASNNVAFNNPLTAGPTALWNLGAFILDEKLNLNVQLQAAEVNGDGKVISSPRVVTLDNTDAVIEQGVSIPFQTFENGDAQLEFVDAVLALKVKPHITADQSIIMDIQVSRNAPDDSVFTLTGSPAIAKNQVKTETLVRDGQTLVIGGIYVVDTSQRQSRVPYLHSIPVLGAAFRSDEFSDSRKELLIFVTPRVVLSQLEAR